MVGKWKKKVIVSGLEKKREWHKSCDVRVVCIASERDVLFILILIREKEVYLSIKVNWYAHHWIGSLKGEKRYTEKEELRLSLHSLWTNTSIHWDIMRNRKKERKSHTPNESFRTILVHLKAQIFYQVFFLAAHLTAFAYAHAHMNIESFRGSLKSWNWYGIWLNIIFVDKSNVKPP